jgi:hypothetical protein
VLLKPALIQCACVCVRIQFAYVCEFERGWEREQASISCVYVSVCIFCVVDSYFWTACHV